MKFAQVSCLLVLILSCADEINCNDYEPEIDKIYIDSDYSIKNKEVSISTINVGSKNDTAYILDFEIDSIRKSEYFLKLKNKISLTKFDVVIEIDSNKFLISDVKKGFNFENTMISENKKCGFVSYQINGKLFKQKFIIINL